MTPDTICQHIVEITWRIAQLSDTPCDWHIAATRLLGLSELYRDDRLLSSDLLFLRDLALVRSSQSEDRRTELLERLLTVLYAARDPHLYQRLTGLILRAD